MNHEANVDLERLINLRIDAVGLDGIEELPPLRELPSDPRDRFWYWIDEPAERISPSSLAMTLYHHATFWSERADTSVALFHYGDMARDLDGEMRRLAAFLEIDVRATKWDELVEAASFANMRARSKELTPEVTTGLVNAETFFRRGSSGGWREFIQTDDDEKRYEARVAELADPDLAQWVHSGWIGRAPV